MLREASIPGALEFSTVSLPEVPAISPPGFSAAPSIAVSFPLFHPRFAHFFHPRLTPGSNSRDIRNVGRSAKENPVVGRNFSVCVSSRSGLCLFV